VFRIYIFTFETPKQTASRLNLRFCADMDDVDARIGAFVMIKNKSVDKRNWKIESIFKKHGSLLVSIFNRSLVSHSQNET